MGFFAHPLNIPESLKNSMNLEHLATEAERLLRDDVLKHVLDTIQADAKEALVMADASNITEIQRLQALARACDDILATLQGYVTRMATPVTGPVA